MEKTNTIETKERKSGKNRKILVVIALFITALFLYVSYRGNYLEAKELGERYLDVLSKKYYYTYITMLVNFAIVYILTYITTKFIKKGLKAFFDEEKKPVPKLPNKSISFILGIILSITTTKIILPKVMLAFNTAWFGINDPIFNTDIGFYFFQEPFIEMVIIYLIVLFVLLTIYTAIYYIIAFNKYFDGINAKTLKRNTFIKQIMTNVLIIAVLISLLVICKTQNIGRQSFLTINNKENTRIIGAGITDVTIKLWGYRILAIVIIASVYKALKAFKVGNTKKIILSVLIVPAYLIILFIIMTLFQLIFVNSNELDKQKNYIMKNIEYTQKAYGVEIEEKQIQSTGTITGNQIISNEEIVNNIPIVSGEITEKTLNNMQTSTGYYSYRKEYLSKYEIDGKEKLVYISPRNMKMQNRSYSNKTYEFTHGYGAIITSATNTLEDGNIEYIQKEFTQDDQKITINNPRIYYGTSQENNVVTNTKNKEEFDYPIHGTDNKTSVYAGKGGLSLNFIDRMILAFKERDINLALSTNINKDSKILINRNIIKRAEDIIPNLIYDENPYLVINDKGELIWVIDAYTVANQYPYSQGIQIEYKNSKQQINYIRNSVKVLVNAYNGTISFYITDKTDPIAMAYKNIYPTLFDDCEEIPQDISKHFRYPQFLFDIQADILEMYHNTSQDVLYRGDDEWEKAKYTSAGTKGSTMESYYIMTKNEENESAQLSIMIPYTPVNKQNMNAYLIGNTKGSKLKLTLYKFSSDNNIVGTMQLDKLLEQDETIEKEISNINVTGTKLIKNMIVIPIEKTLLYVEPIFQQTLNEKNSTPILKKVVVASGNKVAIGNNIKEAINNLVSAREYTSNIDVEDTETINGLVDAIIKANNNLEESSDSSNWEQIGKDIVRLQDLIKKLDELKTKQEKENNNKVMENTITNETVEV